MRQFFWTAVITRIESIGGGRVGGGWGGREVGGDRGGWEAEDGLKQTLKHKWPCYAINIGDPDWHNSLGRPGLPLESVWHPMQSYKCPSGAAQAMKCTLVALQRRKKAT